ncbi:SAM-dependent methyltransferase [Sorangium sp. So ce1335]|uniref:SAM-dependent methyltransferase n=1 Tax=Sorangium sp. So ce1335 TaxID=3133335 RepID=UPI003F5FDC70
MEIDTTKPHIGRVYDYVLGGHHNYDVDRRAATEILKILPTYPKWAKLNRWFIQLVGQQWSDAGITNVLDLASGLPTQGHLNDYLPDARILFSDIDPVSVIYGQKLLAERPNMRYVQADLREPPPLVAAAAKFFGAERRIAVGCIGIAYMMDDDRLRDLLHKLHAFCARGSVLALSYVVPRDASASQRLNGAASLAGATVYPRMPEEMAALISPWKVQGCRPLREWLDLENFLTQEEHDSNPFDMQGLIAHHGG